MTQEAEARFGADAVTVMLFKSFADVLSVELVPEVTLLFTGTVSVVGVGPLFRALPEAAMVIVMALGLSATRTFALLSSCTLLVKVEPFGQLPIVPDVQWVKRSLVAVPVLGSADGPALATVPTAPDHPPSEGVMV